MNTKAIRRTARAIAMLVLGLVLLPQKGIARANCQRYADEMSSTLNQIKELSKHYNGNERILSKEEGEELASKLQALTKSGDAARKKWMECVGMPTSEDEVQVPDYLQDKKP